MAESLEDVQNSLIDKLHAGEPVDRDAVVAAHPEHAPSLRRFFSLLDVIEVAPPSASPMPSRLGDFEIVREIGRGGMGVVYEAEQLSLRRRVALKVLPPAVSFDPRVVDRFQREAESSAKLRHPNIVPVYAVGEAAGTPFFAMELVEGRSLAALVRERRDGHDAGLPPAGDAYRRWAVETIAKVADALAYAHGRGILHRDVKPGNILIDRDGAPRLTDFGLALDLAASSLTLTGEVFGSPQYMSPEQAVRREAPVDQRTDVYSLAVTLYEVLTLRLPYDATTGAELLGALTAGKIVPPRNVDPTIPEPLERVLLGALECDPASRYASAAAFASDLRAVLDARPIAAPARRRSLRVIGFRVNARPVFELPLGTPARRRALAAVAVMVAIIAIVGWMAWMRARESARRSRDAMYVALGDVEASKRLGNYVHPEIHVRRIVSRTEPSPCRIEVRLHANDGYFSNAALYAIWEVSVDGGPFMRLSAPPLDTDAGVALDGPTSAMTTYFAKTDMRTLLGDSLKKESARVIFRITARLQSGRQGNGTFTPPWTKIDVPWTWTSDEKTVFVYDRYPSDYPVSVSGKTDGAVAEDFTPWHLEYHGAMSGDGGTRYVLFNLIYRSNPGTRETTPACGYFDLRAPDGATLATAEMCIDSHTATPVNEGIGLTIGAAFRLEPNGGDAQSRFLLDLEAGRVKELRLVLRPSRDVALEQPDVERYWNGTLDVTVPVTH
ncbi:MAG: serine/threonine protein kinase [Planctomycetes bacterium]|nr:serine/threonine protein kinase [Planctomycetota bacterium]